MPNASTYDFQLCMACEIYWGKFIAVPSYKLFIGGDIRRAFAENPYTIDICVAHIQCDLLLWHNYALIRLKHEVIVLFAFILTYIRPNFVENMAIL